MSGQDDGRDAAGTSARDDRELRGTSASSTEGIVEAMAALRRLCPWSSIQDHGSLEKYAREETEELIEALEDYRADDSAQHRDAVVEELGDVLYQVLFHSALLDESDGQAPYGHTLGLIIDRLEAKLVRRHPFAFGDGAHRASLADVEDAYRRIKAEEKRTHMSEETHP